MAIYSLSMRSVGRTTHAPGTAGAHMRYIGRERAASDIMAHHIPEDPNAARAYVDQHEAGLRKNARIMDKIMIALPRELTEQQRGQLVQDYMHDLTQGGRVPWYAAIHQTEKDAHNPHAHVVIIDRDIDTGKRVLALSDSRRDRIKKGLEPSAAEWVRERWETHANAALERAGHDARIDRRSLEKQGVERKPQIHIGPNAQHIDTHVKKPDSKIKPDPTRNHPDRVIDYPMIDAGRSRRERVAEIIDLNLAKKARSDHFETRILAQFEQEQRLHDRAVDQQIIAANRKRSLEQRRVQSGFAQQMLAIRAERDASTRLKREMFNLHFGAEKAALKASHDSEQETLRDKQSRIWGRLWARLDLSGATRQRRQDERDQLAAQQKTERDALRQRMQEARTVQNAQMQRYKDDLSKVQAERRDTLDAMRQRHELQRRRDDELLQQRARAREQDRLAVVQHITEWKRKQREQADAEKAQRQQKKAQTPPTRLRKDFPQAAQPKPVRQSFTSHAKDVRTARKQREAQRPANDHDPQNRDHDRSHE